MAYRKRKTAALFTALALCLGLLAGCGSEDEETPDDTAGVAPGHELEEEYMADRVFTLNCDFEAGLNPIQAKSSENILFSGLIYDTVFIVDENLEVSSRIVLDYQTTDFEWWTFDVDTSVAFHDGSTLTPDDVVYSIRRAMQYSYYSGRLDCIYGISVLDEDSFAISTTYPNSQFLSRLTVPVIKEGTIDDAAPPGTGPYRLSGDGESLVLFGENPRASAMPIDEIHLADYTETTSKITAFEDSRIDLVTNDPTGMYNLGYGSSNESRYFDTTNMHYLGFNMESLFFINHAMRHAMMYVVDRGNLVDDLMGGCGLVTTLPVLPTSTLYDAAYAGSFSYDMERCENVFRSANIADHDNDGSLEFIIYGIIVEINIRFIVNNDSSVKLQAARQIAEDLNSIGITTTLTELDWDDYTEALRLGNYDMYYGEIKMTPDWNLGYLFDPDTYVNVAGLEEEDLALVDKGMNYANCTEPTYENLYMAYLAADEYTRYDKFQEACRYVVDNGGVIPICFERREVLTHRGIVSGVNATQNDLFNDFEGWTINLD